MKSGPGERLARMELAIFLGKLKRIVLFVVLSDEPYSFKSVNNFK